MYIDPYSTTIMAHYRADKLRNSLRRMMVDNSQNVIKRAPYQGYTAKSVWCVTHADGHQDIDHFTQPIVLGTNCVVVDIRPFTAADRGGNIIVRSQSEYDLLVLRGLLTVEYLNGDGTTAINGLMSNGWRLFDRVITSTLVNSLNLRDDIETQTRISIYTAIYWMGLFYDDAKDLERHGDATVLQLTRMTPHYPNEIASVWESTGAICNVNEFCTKLAGATQNPRIEGLEFKTFYPMINTQWWGVNAREMLGVAMEHIPTFLSLIYMSLTSRNYKRTSIYQRVTDFRDRKVKTTLEETIHRVALQGCK